MLGLFLLPAFTRLGHERWDLLSLCDGMCVCTDQTSVFSLMWKSFGGMESEPMLTPREKSPLLEKNFLRGGSNPQHYIKQDSELNTLPTSYSGPVVSQYSPLFLPPLASRSSPPPPSPDSCTPSCLLFHWRGLIDSFVESRCNAVCGMQ